MEEQGESVDAVDVEAAAVISNTLRPNALKMRSWPVDDDEDEDEEDDSPPSSALVTEAEGHKLHLSSKSNTGYLGVTHKANKGGRYEVRGTNLGSKAYIGTFDTAVEGAVAYAKHIQGVRDDLVTEAEGYKLHMSTKSSTGYKGVSFANYNGVGRYKAHHANLYLNSFETAVEAAVCYAKAVKKGKCEGVVEKVADAGTEAVALSVARSACAAALVVEEQGSKGMFGIFRGHIGDHSMDPLRADIDFLGSLGSGDVI